MKRILLFAVLLMVQLGFGQTNTWDGGAGTSNWGDANNWSPNGVPTAAQDVVIPATFTSVINVDNAVCKSLNIIGTLTIGNSNRDRSLIVSGNVTINGGGIFRSAGNGGNTLLISGNLVNDGTFDMNFGGADAEVTFNGGLTQTISGTGATTDFNSITLTNAFPLVINRGITVDGDWINNGKSVSGSGLVTFTGNSIISGPSVTAFPNLTITGTVLQGVNTTVSGNFTINSGTYRVNDATSYTLTIGGNYNQTGGVFDFNAGTSGTSNVYLAGNLTNSAGSVSISTIGAVKNGILTFNGSGIQTLNMPIAGAAIWAKYVVNTGSTLKLASNFTLNSADVTTQADWVGELTVNGTLDCGTFQVSQSGGVTGVAKLNLNSGATFITANPSGIDGSVLSTNLTRTLSSGANYNFNGTVAQTTSTGMPATVNSLTLSNPSGVTVSKETTVTNNFSIGSGTVANLGTFTHSANTLTLGNFVTSSGSWGSTSSSATNKNNTFFAGTSGIVNITTTTCTPGNWVGVTSTDWNTASNWCGGIPTATTDVVIPSGTPFSPTIATGTTALCRNLTVNASATLSLANSATSLLNISGNFVNNGTFTAGAASTISFVGTNQNVAGVTYSNLTLSGSGTKTFSANTIINSNLIVGTGVVINLNAITTHTAGTLTLGGVGPLLSSWGANGSGATNTNNTYFTGSGRITVNGTPPYPAIDNNFASYTNGNFGTVANSYGENVGPPVFSAPNGTIFINVKFASYGTPSGLPAPFTLGTCDAFNSRTVATAFLGNTTASIGATNAIFDDPCYGTYKRLSIQATYTEPICAGTSPGIITGSTPTGGNGSYTYLWEVSTTSSTTGYSPASGTNNSKDYTPGNVSVTTWYRRTVTSGMYSSATIVIVQVNTNPTVPTNISGTTVICAGSSTTLTVSGGSLGGPGGYAQWYSDSCGGTLIGSGSSITVSPTSDTTYYVRYKSGCSVTGCISVTVTTSVSITNAPTATSVCASASNQTTPLTYSATTGSPSTYSIVWNSTPSNSFVDVTDAALPTGAIQITVPGGTAAGTYTGTLTVRNGTCISFGKTFTITVNPSPTFTTAGAVNPVIFNLSTTISTGLPYTASTNNPVSYTIDWNTIADQGTTPFVFAAGGGTVTGILVPAGTAVGTYTGTMTITTGSGCVFNQAITLTVQPSPAPPLGVSPNLWLKANTGVTNSGTSLSTWADQTGINTFTKQGMIGYNTNAINFNPTASFSHDSSVQTEPTNKLDGNTAIDIGQAFAVYRNFASSNKRNTTLLGNVDAINKGFKGVFFGISLSPTYIYFENSGGSFAAYEAFPNNNGYDQFAVQTLDFSPTAAPFANAWSNSKNILVEPAGGPQADYTVISSVTPLIGGINNLNNYNFNGEVAEIITYPSGLTPLERTKIESYLAIKYGITLDPTIAYYLSNTGNQLWNNTTTYWHDVFGIGREDAYGLNQPQSNSINTGSGDGTGQNGKGNIVLSNPSSLDDGDFLMIGHNNAALTEITTDLPSSLSGLCVRRLTREWKVKRTGDVGTTQLSFDWNGIAVSGTLPTVPGDYYLIIDTDGDGNFTTGTQIVNNVGGFSSTNVIRYNGLALPDGAVFTFGISKKVTWTGGTSTNWNLASNWNTNTVPNATNCVIIPDVTTNPIISGTNTTSNAYTLEVKTGGSLTVNSTNTLSVAQTVTVESGGTLTFEDQSSLVQDAATTSNSNSGEITYKRISSPMKNFDYTYWSSPVTGQNIVALSPNTLADKYFRFDGAADDWEFYNGTMIPGVGYIIRTPKEGNPWPNGEIVSFPYSQPVAFKGVPNNGDYSFAVGSNQLNLIGNPYPSALDADLFMTNLNNANMINGALYFWTHKTAISQSGSNYVYTADDYATYTLTGGVGTGVGTSPSGIAAPTRYIGAGQSFFVESSIAGSFQFTNAMRVAGNNSQFFKQANTKKTATVEKNRVWLNLTNSGGAFKQLLVGYITGATNDWDNLYDGPTFDGQEFVDFYSTNQGKNLTIQGRALPFVETDIVPLGYRSAIAGAFDISIDNRDGALAGQEIWLEDKKTNTLHELSKGKYTFTAINGVENDRFVLKYTNKTLGTDDNEVADKSLIVSVKNKKITLTSSAEAITQVQLFDLLGRKVYDKSKINAQEWSILNLSSSEQTLIVKTTLANGAISNKKIIY